ncbi:peroxisome assembly factor 2 isoform X1 [Erpetoichthys calabaricus]|uniref:peroxisome assembly factor 2 isoform X1 n=1 Tax=Erpetoichthys calabaricus TaxID=27687 RepID=UPI00223499AC|nr:peroxisome assembly factor 2 isoform X1 [Erpetoichthys calabaricus]
MAAQGELQVLEPFPSQHHPLNVLLLQSQARQILACSGDTTCVVLSARSRQAADRRVLFLCAHLSSEEDLPDSQVQLHGDTLLKVYTSRLFYRHYGFQSRERVEVRLVQPLALSKVVLGARSRQCLKWASSEKFANGLLILASCQKQSLLARQGDVLAVPYHPLFGEDVAQVHHHLLDLVVLESVPVQQGVITVKTSVVVADFREVSVGAANHDGQHHGQRLLQSLYVSDFAHYVNSLASGGSLLDSRRHLNWSFSSFLQALECRFEVRVADVDSLLVLGKIKPKDQRETPKDPDACLFVSKSSLLKLGLFNNEWVTVSMLSEKVKMSSKSERLRDLERSDDKGECEEAGRSRSGHLALLVVAEFTDLPDSVGLVSPSLWFNLSKGAPVPITNKVVKIKRCYEHQLHTAKQEKESRSCTSAPSVAKELYVEIITSPTYSTTAIFDNILYEYFRTPRLVQQGDVLRVNTEGQAEYLEGLTTGFMRWPVLYFKVKKVHGHNEDVRPNSWGYLADTTHTSLYLIGTASSYVPCSFMGSEPTFWNNLSPPGLTHSIEQLISTIQPYTAEGSTASLDRPCTVLLKGHCGSGKTTAVKAACSRLNLHLLKIDCVTLSAETTAASVVKLQSAFNQADLHKPCVILLRNLQLLGRHRDGRSEDSRVTSVLKQLLTDSPKQNSFPVVVVGTVSKPEELFPDVIMSFVHDVAIESPSEEQRKATLMSLTAGMPLGKDVSLCKIAKQTAGFFLGDLCALLAYSSKTAYKRVFSACFPCGTSLEEEQMLCDSGITIIAEDFLKSLEQLNKVHSKAIGAPKIPAVKWHDIGGLHSVKKEILDTVQLPVDHPELVSLGLRRSGLLLYGPPGTGKTLLAKAVATECAMTFLSVKGPELINMYVGQSEENIRDVFAKARAASPCIIFFDELDSLAPNRGRSGDSGGVMDRVVSQLLAELDGLHSSADVFVIGATNRPDLLDQSLLRPGRFDKLLYVGINEDKESQLQVLKAISSRFKMDPSVCLHDVIERCPPQLTGADLYALCSDAMMSALKQKIKRIEEGLETEESDLVLRREDFQNALEKLQPSVSEQELLKYKLIQQKFTAN